MMELTDDLCWSYSWNLVQVELVALLEGLEDRVPPDVTTGLSFHRMTFRSYEQEAKRDPNLGWAQQTCHTGPSWLKITCYNYTHTHTSNEVTYHQPSFKTSMFYR